MANLLVFVELFSIRPSRINMLCTIIGFLCDWSLLLRAVLAAEALPSNAVQQATTLAHAEEPPAIFGQITKRQSNSTSACKAYGVDYQDGESYFVDQRSQEFFRAVTKFERCQKGTADVLLVDRQTAQQYACGQIPTTPDDAPQMATCQVRESDMWSGNWSLLILGDNAKGKPFAYQRDFTLQVAAQQTVTVSKTCVYTYTEKPMRTITSTYVLAMTSTLPNPLTLTRAAATSVLTITPKLSTIVATVTTTRTFTTWTRTEERSTVVLTPSCTLPPRPMLPDGMCKIVPTLMPVPKGLEMPVAAAPAAAGEGKREDRAADGQDIPKRFEDLSAVQSHVAASTSSPAPAPPSSAGGLQPTITITARTPINSTTTLTLHPKTLQIISTSTHMLMVAAPPKTVLMGAAIKTAYAPAVTETQVRRAWTRVYEVQTMRVSWTWTSTAGVGKGEREGCRARGGWME